MNLGIILKIFTHPYLLPVLKVLVLMTFSVRKKARIRNQYNQVPHLTQDTTWESDKSQLDITNKSQEVSPFPAGDHTAAMNRRKSMTTTRDNNTNDPQKKYFLEQSVKYFLGGLKPVSRHKPHP